jgi:two-component system, sensor histidine kinase YesM
MAEFDSKKISRENVRKRIFAKLMMAFLVTVIPIYITGIIIYYRSINTVQNNIIHQNVSQLEYYLTELSKEVEQIRVLQSRYLTGRDISWLTNAYNIMDNYDKGYYLLRVQDNMVSIKSSSIYLKKVTAYIPGIGKKISTTGGNSALLPEEMKKFDLYDLIKDTNIYTNGSDLSIVLSYPPSSYFMDKEPSFIIESVFELSALKKSLEQFNYYEGSGTLMFRKNYPTISSIDKNTDITNEVVSQISSKMNTNSDSGSFSAVIGEKKYLVNYAYSTYLGYTLGSYMPESEIFRQVNTNQYIIRIFSTIAVAIIVAFALFIYQTILSPMNKLIGAFKKVESGDRQFVLTSKNRDEFNYVYSHFNDMLTNINELIMYTYEQKLMLKDAELEYLQAQINTHFIYNSYYLLNRLVKSDDKENAVYFSKQLGTYFKYITHSNGGSVALSKEIEHAYIYAEIQGMRFEGRIEIFFNQLPVEYENILVPRFIIQPILENAFKYALSDKLTEGKLCISFENTMDFLIVIVEDNGENLTDETIEKLRLRLDEGDVTSEESIGLMNIHRRLQITFPQQGKMDISRSDLGGMKVMLYIPFVSGVIIKQPK